MKTFSDEWQQQLIDGGGVTHGAVLFSTTPPFGVWGGHGTLTLDGEDYLGIGGRGLVTALGGQGGSAEGETELTLSGADPEQIALLEVTGLERAPAAVWRLGCNVHGTVVLDAQVWARGKVRGASREETIGGEAALKVSVEGAVSGLGQSGGRMATDTDQRLIDPDDAAFRRTGPAAFKIIYWAGQPPAGPGHVFPATSQTLSNVISLVLGGRGGGAGGGR